MRFHRAPYCDCRCSLITRRSTRIGSGGEALILSIRVIEWGERGKNPAAEALNGNRSCFGHRESIHIDTDDMTLECEMRCSAENGRKFCIPYVIYEHGMVSTATSDMSSSACDMKVMWSAFRDVRYFAHDDENILNE